MGAVRSSVFVCALALALFAGLQDSPSIAAGGGVATVDQARIEHADSEPGNWLSYGRTYSEQRFSPLAQIDTTNVGKLGLAWTYQMQEGRGAEGTPIVVDGVMYVTSAWSVVYAVDARTGKQLWVFDPKVDRTVSAWSCCDVVNRGVAVWKGKVYDATIDGRLVAIDAKKGTKVWDVVTVDQQSKVYVSTGAPRVAKGLVFIGNSGAEYGARGYLTAYDAETGAKKWRFYTVPGDPAKGPDHEVSDPQIAQAAVTWGGKFWQYGGGGTVWDSIVYDPELDQLYFGTGNGTPWNHQIRSPGGGDNLFLTSIIAVKPDTGEYLWHFQEVAGESWDYTATQPIMLATLKMDGVDRKVLMQAPKDGFFYILDRATGKFLSGKNFIPMAKAADTPPGNPISWAYALDANGRALENPQARFVDGPALISPSGGGGHNWHPMSYSPLTGYVYIPVRRTFGAVANDPNYVYDPRFQNTGYGSARGLGSVPQDMSKGPQGELIAWDPIAQKEVWSVPDASNKNGGTVVTAGNVVFWGDAGGTFAAFDARDGKKLWSADAGMAIHSGAMTYEVDGVQYVAVLTGASFLTQPRIVGLLPKSRVLVYKLNGTAKPMPYPKPDPTPKPPVMNASAEDVARGQQIFGMRSCGICHGPGAVSAGVVPDLRRSPFIQDKDAFYSVLQGALYPNGMPEFKNLIKPEDAELLRAYLAAQAEKLYTAENRPK